MCLSVTPCVPLRCFGRTSVAIATTSSSAVVSVRGAMGRTKTQMSEHTLKLVGVELRITSKRVRVSREVWDMRKLHTVETCRHQGIEHAVMGIRVNRKCKNRHHTNKK
uniref:Uncharacterized protein n=1 Tax=Ixodes ricinus TaxID=34613 RepID=A0A6B0UHW7_IXORI